MHAVALAALVLAPVAQTPPVHLLRVPDGGIQPQALTAPEGTLHLLYYKGDPKAGDLFYATRPAGTPDFAPAIRVNSQPGSAIAIGNDRGGQIALGKTGRIHVAWNGSSSALPKAPPSPAVPKDSPHSGTPMLYTRLDASGAAFEPQRNLMTRSTTLDGGGSVAADRDGLVYVVWHALPVGPDTQPSGEAFRRVFVAQSRDDGATFEPEAPVSPERLGACGCCGLRAFTDQTGALHILFRAAERATDRDMYLLRGTYPPPACVPVRLDPWRINACPMTTAAAAITRESLIMAWETADQIRLATQPVHPGPSGATISMPGKLERRKYPALAVNPRGEVLVAWTEGMAWAKPGSVHWQVFTPDLTPIPNASGHADGVPAWSLVAAAANPDGSFSVIY